MPNITQRTLSTTHPKSVAFFIRDTKVKGFAIKVNPSGSMKYIAEVYHDGRSVRKTLGEHPIVELQDARNQALKFIQQVRTGQLEKVAKIISLETLFERYTKGDRLKPNTLRNYREVIHFYLSDWLKKPVSSITKQMVEKKFYQIRDKGINGGIPTYSQATKVMRILSALMNYARADEIIENIRQFYSYLKDEEGVAIENPVVIGLMLREPHPLPRYIPDSELDLFLRCVASKRDLAIFMLMLRCGYTLASGSSSTAAAAVAHKLGLCDKDILVHMPGGEIRIQFNNGFFATMTGPVTKVCNGTMTTEMFKDSF